MLNYKAENTVENVLRHIDCSELKDTLKNYPLTDSTSDIFKKITQKENTDSRSDFLIMAINNLSNRE